MLLRKIILFPLSTLYLFATSVRNYLYNKAVFRQKGFDFPIICAGNLKAGGTGKTPHVEYLAEFLKNKTRLVILSRGYGRKTRGFLLADQSSKPEEIGDEPAQYVKKFGTGLHVAVGEDRAGAVNKLIKIINPQCVLLDDAFQHRKIKAGLNILLTEYADLFYNDTLLPGGLLRESKYGAGRADIIIITKCPDVLSDQEKSEVTEGVRKYAGTKPVFFTTYVYGEPESLGKPADLEYGSPVIAFAGIANPDKFFSYVGSRFRLVRTFRFRDHKNYGEEDLQKLVREFHNNHSGPVALITTEKDGVKLAERSFPENLPLFCIPVKVKFLEGEQEFLQLIMQFVTLNTL
jgi:tetraacyldisaccharide 4'-kinase